MYIVSYQGDKSYKRSVTYTLARTSQAYHVVTVLCLFHFDVLMFVVSCARWIPLCLRLLLYFYLFTVWSRFFYDMMGVKGDEPDE